MNSKLETRNAKLLSTFAAATLIGCSDDTVRRLALDGHLHGWRLTDGGRMQITRASVEAYIRRRQKANFHSGRTR